MTSVTADSGFVGLFRRNRSFRLLLAAQSISDLGDWFNTVALMGMVYARTDSGLMVSLILIASALPPLLLSPISGVLLDRGDKKTVMIGADLLRALFVPLLLLSGQHFWVVFPVKMLISILTGFFSPARQAVLPAVVRQDEVVIANASSSMVSGLMGALGACLGGLVSAWAGYGTAFVIDSGTFIVSALLILRVSVPRSVPSAGRRSGVGDLMEGYRFVYGSRIVSALILAGISWGIVGGAYYVLLPIYGAKILGRGDSGIGTLYAIDGLGVLIGGAVVQILVGTDADRMKKAFGFAYLLQGALFACFVFSSSFAAAAGFLLLMRIFSGLIIPLDASLIQMSTPETIRGRVFTLHWTSYGACMQVSMFCTGLLLANISPRGVGLIAASGCLVVSSSWLAMLYSGGLDAPRRASG
jgi:MFS family permease